jgi:hypothetical protein
MTLASWFYAFVPTLFLAAAAVSVYFGSVLSVFVVIYVVPPLLYRTLLLRPGLYDLKQPKFNAWWATHQLQQLYIAVPALEALLRVVPGLYSAWLRLWGSKIGGGVHWTPRMEVLDRGLLEVGDGVVFGHKVELYGHTVMPKGERLLLYVDRVKVGAGAFVGAGSRLAPGVVVEAGAVVPILTDLYMKTRYKAKKEGEHGPLDPARAA